LNIGVLFKKMTIQDLAAIGEIIGAIAVVITLLYLSLQLRQFNKGLRSSTFHNTMHEFNQINASQLDPALAGLLDKGLAEPDSLTAVEKYQYAWIMRSYVNIWENMYQQYLEGACPESYWLPYAKQAKSIIEMPGGKLYRTSNTLNAGLYSYLDGLPIEDFNADFNLKESASHTGT
jgi:hypothetical protein